MQDEIIIHRLTLAALRFSKKYVFSVKLFIALLCRREKL